MEDAAHLAWEIGVEHGVVAGAEFATAARLLGKRTDERNTAREAVEVVPFRQEAVVDGGGNPRVRRSQTDGAAGIRLEQVHDRGRPPAVVRFLEPWQEVEV